jgi:hypothetical protein
MNNNKIATNGCLDINDYCNTSVTEKLQKEKKFQKSATLLQHLAN